MFHTGVQCKLETFCHIVLFRLDKEAIYIIFTFSRVFVRTLQIKFVAYILKHFINDVKKMA